MWLSNVHPVTWEDHLVDLLFIRHFWEDLSLDGGRPVLNSINHSGIEEVQTCIDFVRDKYRWFLNELLDLIVIVSDDHAIFCWVFNLGYHDGTFTTVRLVELDHLVQRVVADDV